VFGVVLQWNFEDLQALNKSEAYRKPFELGVEPLVVSERWSCWGCLRQAWAGSFVAVRPEELNKFFRPSLPV
jgi:hypothetical protein